jgi:putative glycosyltransferase (TIGR04372 family)
MIKNNAFYVIRLKFNRKIFKLLLGFLRYLESQEKPKYNETYTDVVKKSNILKITNSELNLISELNKLEVQYNNGEYHQVVSKRIEIYEELYEKQKLDKNYFPKILGSIWTNVIGHEALIGVLHLCANYNIVHEGKRDIQLIGSKNQSLLLGMYSNFLNVNYSDSVELDISNFPSQFHKFENLMLWKTKSNFEDNYALLDKVFKEYDNDKDSNLFEFSFDQEELYFNKLEQLGLPKKSWFIVIHVKETPKNTSGRRSASVKNFEKSCKYIIAQGGWVIQIGFKNSTKINLDKNYIDARGDSVELTNFHLFVLAKAKFYLGTMTGLNPTASLFKTPSLITNSVTLGRNTINYNAQTRYLPKTVLNLQNGQKLNFEKILQTREGFGDLDTKGLLEDSLSLIENSSEEIYNATLDFYQNLCNSKSQSKVSIELANKVDKIRSRFAFTSTGLISESYLMNNPDWLSCE